ncbi:hypothetical protein Glove_22g13 [Diversispora epigaea]|uniref:Uncharacterized protein n=1 Tax=Diversispora epigaea TaxID=1348612 RepID=A0A397JMA6_9GLOM|nr:hypothetical protein Glove_22g13 [Diversispora epigaea]
MSSWKVLQKHYEAGKHLIMKDLFCKTSPKRVEEFRDKMCNGEHINFTEDRAVLHIALGNVSNNPICDNDANVVPEVNEQNIVTNEKYIRCYSIDLDLVMVTEALKPYSKPGLNAHFVSNIDGTHLIKKQLPMQISQRNGSLNVRNAYCKAILLLFRLISKSVAEFGIDHANMFKFWDRIRGRYSLWSDQNLQVIMAVLGAWYNDFFKCRTHAILPYDQYLHRFPAYFQQGDQICHAIRTNCQLSNWTSILSINSSGYKDCAS